MVTHLRERGRVVFEIRLVHATVKRDGMGDAGRCGAHTGGSSGCWGVSAGVWGVSPRGIAR